MSRIVVAGSFDSKAVPLNLLIAALRGLGEAPFVIDTSVYPGDHGADVPAREVAARAGADAERLAERGRARAVGTMAGGAAAILQDMVESGAVAALLCMGGSNAATVFSRLAPVLPLGIPKILMATVVAGDTRPIIGAGDAVLIYPVADVEGDNTILRRMIARAAKLAAAIRTSEPLSADARSGRAVALTMSGVTTPCASRVRARLAGRGAEAYVFHANGTGGRTIELFARQGLVDGIVEASLTELADELFGGAFPAGEDRLCSAAKAGVPQVIAPGAIDMIKFGPRPTVPERFEGRNILAHNDLVTLVRTTPDECFEIGRTVADRLGTPSGPTAVVIPLGGVSMLDKAGEAFWDPDAVRAFRDGLGQQKAEVIEVIEADHNINDEAFADRLAAKLESFLER